MLPRPSIAGKGSVGFLRLQSDTARAAEYDVMAGGLSL